MTTKELTKNEIELLWDEYQANKSETAREKLLINYLPLVKIISGRMKVTLPNSVEFDDLVSAGMVGLVNSIDNFMPEKGIKFETYAAQRIRGSILDGLRDVDWLPRSYRQKSRKLDQTMEKLVAKLGRIPTDEEIADELKMDIDSYYRYIDHVGAASLISLDRNISQGDQGESASMHEIMPDDKIPDPYEQIEESDMQQTALNLIDEMSDQERTVVALYYYEALTFREIGEVIGVSESRVCQIHTKIISSLRVNLKKLLV